MIHSARPTVSPVATIIFCCFVLLDLKWGRTYGRKTCAKIIITTGRDFGSKLQEFALNVIKYKRLSPSNQFLAFSVLNPFVIQKS